jgi:hypothetical protein
MMPPRKNNDFCSEVSARELIKLEAFLRNNAAGAQEKKEYRPVTEER